MGVSRPPLRAAFWAICASLLLMLLATLSDPYRVRQSLLTQRSADGSRADVAASGTRDQRTLQSDQKTGAALTQHPDVDRSFGSALITREAAVSTPPTGDHADSAPLAGTVQMHVVSAGDAGGPPRYSRPVVRPAMPILAPGEVTGPTTGGRFEELPPPPELAQQRESIHAPLVAAEADLDHATQLALERLQLETELLTLRHDLSHSIESRQIEQMQHLQQQQGTLLEQQQQTAERLEELADHLATQSARLDRLFETQAMDAPPETTGAAAHDAPGGPHLEQTADGRHRLWLVIESDDVAGILERLGRWSSASALQEPRPPMISSTIVEPQPRYLAPPSAYSDPTPLSDLESPPGSVSGGATPPPGSPTGGPLFAPPGICR